MCYVLLQIEVLCVMLQIEVLCSGLLQIELLCYIRLQIEVLCVTFGCRLKYCMLGSVAD